MDTKEAAKELGISSRSLQRAVSSKRLNVSYQRGRSGKMEAIYDPDEVARYKASLSEIVQSPKADERNNALLPTTRDTGLSRTVILNFIEELSSIARTGNTKAQVTIGEKLMLTLADAAVLSSLSENYLREAVKAGKLKGRVIGRGYKIKRMDLDAYIKKL